MDTSPPPRPAATVLALRDGAHGVEVLMLRRNLNSDFVGGAYVFPGGGVDEGDAALAARCVGPDDAAASARLGLDSGGLAYHVAALRELFEEAGLMVACDAGGAPVALDAEATRRRDRLRRKRNEGALSFADVLAAEGLWLDLRGMVYLAHWVTPVGPPRRYDTRFFVVRAPEDQVAGHDAGETVADRWVTPAEALAAHERGELEMIFPTIRTLMSIAPFESVDAVLGFASAQETVTRVQPRIVTRDGQVAILLPGDPGYDD